jgi:hypothetical protein
MYVEEYHVERVIRQFGLYQALHVPVTHRLPVRAPVSSLQTSLVSVDE